jgi:hypothetical protein
LVFVSERELRVGDDLHQRVADAIAKSTYVAVVVSARFDTSKWTKDEVSQALSREKVVDTKTMTAIKNAGGEGTGDKVRFNPAAIIANPNTSPSLRLLMRSPNRRLGNLGVLHAAL